MGIHYLAIEIKRGIAVIGEPETGQDGFIEVWLEMRIMEAHVLQGVEKSAAFEFFADEKYSEVGVVW
jgi:hypothetical protein